jgi:hypothetical protein
MAEVLRHELQFFEPQLNIQTASRRISNDGSSCDLRAYGVRYFFVIYGFFSAETENRIRSFLLGRALEGEG